MKIEEINQLTAFERHVIILLEQILKAVSISE